MSGGAGLSVGACPTGGNPPRPASRPNPGRIDSPAGGGSRVQRAGAVTTKVLVVGAGGREHVLCRKLSRSAGVDAVFCAPGNAGTRLDAENVDIPVTDTAGLVEFAKANGVGLTVIGPEIPLVAGLADALRKEGLTAFGPSKAAAELEGSKAFSKALMKRAGIPTAEFQTFTRAEEAEAFITERSEQPLVVKADGLAAGKGVAVCSTKDGAVAAVRRMLVGREFGAAGGRVVVEERLEGEEVSLLALVDGTNILPLEPAQDHKAARDGDRGPNTGGMGAYSPARVVTPARMDEVIERVLIPTVHSMARRDRPFTGVLYAGLMFTPQGARVLEFNVRFGDPEAQPVLSRLKTDLFPVLLAAAEGRLAELDPLEWDERAAVCVVMASEGYPGEYETGKVIRGLAEASAMEAVEVFHAGTATNAAGETVTAGGRVLGVTALDDTVTAAKLRAYRAVKAIRWDGAWCRTDISDRAR